MDQIGLSRMDLNSDTDLESGGTTREEDEKMGQVKSKISSKVTSSASSYKSSTDAGDSENPSSVDEIYCKNKEERLRVGMGNYVDKKRVMKPSAARPPRPHRTTKDTSLSPYDVKLLKEMYALNLNRKKMGRIRTFNKMKRQKGPSLKSHLLAFFVTIVFFAVIILQGLLGSRV